MKVKRSSKIHKEPKIYLTNFNQNDILNTIILFTVKGYILMSKIIIPDGYRPTLGLYDTQTAIGMLKRIFEEKLCFVLNLKRVSAPLFVDPETGDRKSVV